MPSICRKTASLEEDEALRREGEGMEAIKGMGAVAEDDMSVCEEAGIEEGERGDDADGWWSKGSAVLVLGCDDDVWCFGDFGDF